MDDNERMVQLLDELVSRDEELEVVGKAGNGEELINIIREKKPDVVLLDMIMPKLDGLTVMDRVNHETNLKKPAFRRFNFGIQVYVRLCQYCGV